MDIASLVASFATGTYVVTRRAAATLDRGRAQTKPATTFTILASVSPTSGADLQRLPEGRRNDESVAIYTDTMLTIGGQGAAFETDTISIDGRQWEVSNVQTWRDSLTGSTGYKAIAICQVG